jgi:hypothetical protein
MPDTASALVVAKLEKEQTLAKLRAMHTATLLEIQATAVER